MQRRKDKRVARTGFTLVELLIVVAMIGILSTIAIPRYRDVVVMADATAILADADMIEKAGYQHQAESGQFPRFSGWGSMPSEMEKFLPGGFEFEYKDVAEYAWLAWTFDIPRPSATGVTYSPFELVLIGVQSSNTELISAIRELHGGQTLGYGQYVWLVLRWGMWRN